MRKYLQYEIENLEPIKTSSTLMQLDYETSKNYISGSVVRGAYIYNYILINNIKDINKGEHKDKLLKGNMKFLNAYPVYDDERTYPFPVCFYTTKNKMKNFKSGNSDELEINLDKSKLNKDEDIQRVKGYNFVSFSDGYGSLTQISVDKESYLHINKATGDENNKIFRYEAIAPFNKFRGIVEFTGDNIDENIQEFKKIIESGTFYLGGAKGTGYGLCKISIIEDEVSENPEWSYFEDNDLLDNLENSKNVYLYALSDIIFRDSLGRYNSYIDSYLIEKKLNLSKVELKNSFIQTEIFTGFNSKWGYRMPLIKGIKAGSIMKYAIEGEIDIEALKDFVAEGIGERKSEGFGRFILLDNFNFEELVREKKEDFDENIEPVHLNTEEEAQMQNILNKIYNAKLDNYLIYNVMDLSHKLEDAKNNINSNQWGKLYSLMYSVENMPCEEGKKKIQEYFDVIESKVNNRQLTDCFNKVFIGKKNIRKYIITELEDLNENNFYGYFTEKIKISNLSSKITSEKIYRFKVKVLKEAFRLQYKKGEVE